MEKVKRGVGGTVSDKAIVAQPRRSAESPGWSAPPTPAPPTLFTRASNVTDAVVLGSDVLDTLVDETPGVTGAILASVDGFEIARSASMTAEPSHAAMLAAAVGVARELATVGGGRRLRQLVVDHDAGLLLVWPIRANRVLAVLAATSVEQRRVRAFVHSSTSMLAQLAGGES